MRPCLLPPLTPGMPPLPPGINPLPQAFHGVFLAFLTGMLCHTAIALQIKTESMCGFFSGQSFLEGNELGVMQFIFFRSVTSLVGAFKLFWEFVPKVLSWCKLLYNSLTLLYLPPDIPLQDRHCLSFSQSAGILPVQNKFSKILHHISVYWGAQSTRPGQSYNILLKSSLKSVLS